jgi:acyl carrier protein
VIDRAQLTKEVIGIVAELTGVDRALIRPEMPLMGKELAIDSLVMVRLLVRIEERFSEQMRKNPEGIDVTSVDTIVDFLVG